MKEISGKTIYVIGVIIIGSLLLFSFFNNRSSFYNTWNITDQGTVFADFYNLTGAAETYCEGGDPFVSNIYDPWNRTLNHPSWVPKTMNRLGLHTDKTVYIGTVILLFYILSTIIISPKSKSGAIVLLLVALSPASITGLERANHDLILFILLTLGIWSNHLSILGGTILLGAAIKLFPIFAIPSLISFKRKEMLIGIGVVSILFLIFIAINNSELSFYFGNTQKGTGDHSYGVATLPGLNGVGLSHLWMPALVILIPTFYHIIITKTGILLSDDRRVASAFIAGCSIYIATFLLGSNWLYRLIFLHLTIPQLNEWWSNKNTRKRGIIFTIGIILVHWRTAYAKIGTLFSEMSTFSGWFLFMLLSYAMIGVVYEQFYSNKRSTTK